MATAYFLSISHTKALVYYSTSTGTSTSTVIQWVISDFIVYKENFLNSKLFNIFFICVNRLSILF